MKTILSILPALLLFAACSSDISSELNQHANLSGIQPLEEKQQKSVDEVRYSANANATSGESNSNKSVASGHKVIMQGDVAIESKDIRNSRNRLDEVLKRHKGYVDQESFRNTDSGSNYEIGVRIPSDGFEPFMHELLDGKDKLLSKNISSKDVTAEYTDVQLRLNTRKAYYQRYTQLLDKARTIKEIMSIDEQLRALQEEIESSEGQLRYWDDQVSYSTLWLTYSSPQKLGEISEITFGDKAGDSLSSGWESVIGFILGLVRIWPLLLIIAGVAIVARRRNWFRRSGKTA